MQLSKLFFRFLLSLLLALPLTAAGSIATKSFLWEVSTPKGSIYLLGSIHVAKQSLFPLKPAIESAYRQSDFLAVEVDMNKAADKLPGLLFSHAFFSDEKGLKDHISSENYTLLSKHLKTLSHDPSRYDGMKPWYISLILTNLSLERIGAHSYYGVDSYFSSRALDDKKPIIELEGAAMQIGMLDDLPMKEQEMLMVSSIVEDDKMEKSFEGMMRLWIDGDIKGMEEFLDNSMEPYPELKEFNDKFLFLRNRQMADKIDNLLQEGKKGLVVVGVAHYLGEKGIIALLRKKGYTIRQR